MQLLEQSKNTLSRKNAIGRGRLRLFGQLWWARAGARLIANLC